MVLSLQRVRDPFVAIIAAVLLTLGFPKLGAAWLVPFGTAALFWVLANGSWKRSFWLGWLAGVVFFSINYSWWTYTIGHDVGPFWAYAAVFAAGIIDGFSWAVAGALVAIAQRRAPPALAAVAAAAAFAVMECARSVGPLGVPFAQLGYTQAETPLRVFAAYAGTYGVTFVLCAIGAIGADAFRRRTLRFAIPAYAVLLLLWAQCWNAWPARNAPPPTIPVAAIQGNIVQTLKWQPGALELAISRYTTMTASVAQMHPKLVVWPETVIALRGEGLNEDAALETKFGSLASRMRATLVVGSIETRDDNYYNALFFFGPRGERAVYEKRALVPFAEDFPGSRYLFWLPFVGTLNGGFSAGTLNGVYPTAAGLFVAPLICWESGFADLAHAQIARGAQLLVVSTDDAWFGETSGPYQHAQISQMRAVENGTWLVRAAATGISGIIAPDGHWTARTPMDVQRSVVGLVGRPTGSAFAHIGPTPVVAGLALLYLLSVGLPYRREKRS